MHVKSMTVCHFQVQMNFEMLSSWKISQWYRWRKVPLNSNVHQMCVLKFTRLHQCQRSVCHLCPPEEGAWCVLNLTQLRWCRCQIIVFHLCPPRESVHEPNTVWYHQRQTLMNVLSSQTLSLPRDSYAKRGICRRRVSVCVCVCHTPVLYQNG